MKIDTTYLAMHPRTARWQDERKTCEACAHLERHGTDPAMRCAKLPAEHVNRWQQFGYCIDAREAGMPCGPKARQFQATEAAA